MARILLMDDDIQLGLELSGALQRAGHDVTLATSATEARETLWHWDFDVLITDMVVRKDGKPVADGGLGLISWARHTAMTNNLPQLLIIAITGEVSQDWMKFLLPTAERVGADLLVEKPVKVDDLLKAIKDGQLDG